MVFHVHPRKRKTAAEFGFEFDGIRAIEPLGFLEFLQLEANARLALTDSGRGPGRDVPSGSFGVTLQGNTERPETVAVGSNTLAGLRAGNILDGARKMMTQENEWRNPFGAGQAGKMIVDCIIDSKENLL